MQRSSYGPSKIHSSLGWASRNCLILSLSSVVRSGSSPVNLFLMVALVLSGSSSTTCITKANERTIKKYIANGNGELLQKHQNQQFPQCMQTISERKSSYCCSTDCKISPDGTPVKAETYLNIIIDMTILVWRGDKLIVIVCPFTINNVLIFISSFL